MLQKQLFGKRYLIVLDNVWESKAWDDLQACFPFTYNGSRILVTTRDKGVASYAQRYSDPHSLPFLTDEESWELLKNKVFQGKDPYVLPFLKDEKSWELLQKKVFQGEDNSCPLELQNVGRLVASQCKGLPSLIITIAGILSSKKREESLWLEVAYDISSYACAEKKSMKMIQSSYDHLPDHLTLVRVLHLLDIYLDNSLASAFQSLPDLRYLAIFVKAFDAKWVSHLLHLQTLRVRSSYIMISPAIWKMSKLRHVDINEFPITISCKEDENHVLHNLKTLGMCYMSLADMTPNFWDKFPNLEQLRLHINEFIDHVPNALMNLDVIFPSRLRSLSLTEIFLTDEIVSSIANLQNLETLKLSEIYFIGENKHWDLTDNTFVRLRFLKLHRVFMNKWSCSEESFPRLEYLVVKSCSKLEEIPRTFAEFVTLQSIKVIDCSDSVGNSAVKIREELKDYTANPIRLHILKKDE